MDLILGWLDRYLFSVLFVGIFSALMLLSRWSAKKRGEECVTGGSILADGSILPDAGYTSPYQDFDTCGGINDDSHYHFFDTCGEINPATGLPMVGSIDVEGNPYGCAGPNE